MADHHIQRQILERLMRADSLRFSDLKPEGMESNLFMYHLKQVIGETYVEKTERGYRLTPAGLSYVDGLSAANHKPRKQPKLIAILALQDYAGRWLLTERKVQPYLGTRMFPSGKQHRGETSTEHAARELYEKTALTGVTLTRRGSVEVLISAHDEELLTHVMAHVYTGVVSPDMILLSSERFENIWHDFEHDESPLMPGTAEVYQLLQSGAPFHSELRVPYP